MNRGGPLERRTPLSRVGFRPRGAPMPSVTPSAHRLRKDAWAAVRAAVWARSAGRCERCSEALDPDAWECHHRQLRARGGPDAIYNAVALDGDCHGHAPYGVHRREEPARERGLIIASWEDPETVPLWLPDGRRVLPSEDGRYIEVPA